MHSATMVLVCLLQKLFCGYGAQPKGLHTAPVVSFIAELNEMLPARHSMTVSGLAFGPVDGTTSVRLGATGCSTVMWASATAVACRLAPSGERPRAVAVTASGLVGTGKAYFTFDGEEIPKFICHFAWRCGSRSRLIRLH